MGKSELIVSFGRNLKRLRLEKGFTQTSLAFEIGVEPSHLSKIERGLHEPGLTIIVAIARALQCKFEDLIEV